MRTEYGQILLPIARSAIAEKFGQTIPASEDDSWLQEHRACFVTLTQRGQLRGCIGSLEAHRSLLLDVKANAQAAAFHDPRFSPLTKPELDTTEVEVSLLSVMQDMTFHNEQDALAQLRPEIDGILFEYGHYRSTFLPQVWEQLPDPSEFMAHLKHKAGLSPGFWAEGVKLSRYTVSKWKEGAPTE
uniref:AMMECR1 n=1 Tax=mine drainage metagenome TaxID=410659 RepID=E6QRN7_9ZZZZ